MSKIQPSYTKEFKQQAVQLFETSGKNKTQIARDLGISDSALSKVAFMEISCSCLENEYGNQGILS